MHFSFRILALCSALLFAIAASAAEREPTPQEVADLTALIDSGDLEAAEDLLGTYFFKEIGGTTIDVQTMRLRYFRKAFDDAFGIAERILAANPRNTDALNSRGLVKAERQDAAGALADFDAAIAIDPTYVKANINRARLFCAQQRFDEADKAFDAARERVTDKASVFDAQFMCHFAAGRHESAIEVGEAWFMHKPEFRVLGRLVQVEHAHGQYDKAYKTYLKALTMYGSNNDFQAYLARIFLEIGGPELALKSFNELIAETPGNPHLYLERGEAYDMLGRDDEALADYNRGFATVDGEPPPKRARPMALRGVIKLERGDIAGATADFDTAIANDPNDPVGWYWRGEMWMRSGNHDAAISAYQSALRVLPEDKTYLAALEKAQAAKK